MDHKTITVELTPLNIEIINRVAQNNPDTMVATLEWMAGGLTHVTTQTAFQLARGGGEVYMFYGDGTDSLLDDIGHEADYYLAPECLDEKGKPKTYPEIETIFLVEGKL